MITSVVSHCIILHHSVLLRSAAVLLLLLCHRLFIDFASSAEQKFKSFGYWFNCRFDINA